MENTAIVLIVLALIFAGSIWLQIFLSQKNNKWLGLLIPLLCLMFSMMAVLSIPMYTAITGTTSVTETIDGTIVTEEIITSQSAKPSMLSMLAAIIPVFLLTNIPTLLYLAIYFACREKLKTRSELDKMNIQDLK